MYKLYCKRLIDIVIGFLALLFLSPLLIIVGVLLFIINKGNPFFFQEVGDMDN